VHGLGEPSEDAEGQCLAVWLDLLRCGNEVFLPQNLGRRRVNAESVSVMRIGVEDFEYPV
jgi:hypothetical protein